MKSSQMQSHATTRLEETVNRFCQFITALPASTLAEQDWGPKEVLAHLVYHHELYVNLIEAYLAGRPLAPPRGRFRDLNAGVVTASKGIGSVELVHRLQMANQRLVDLYQQYDPSRIPVEIKAGARLRTLAELVPEVEAHVRNHLVKLRKALQAGLGDASQHEPPDKGVELTRPAAGQAHVRYYR